jgi:hypothetical protein
VKKHLLLLGIAMAAPGALHAQKPIGEVFSSDASVRGSVVLAGSGTHILSGTQIAAGDGVALLKLERGGQLRICPKTSLSLSADESGRSLVLGLNSGSVELNYTLRSAADSVVTPDFRLQLISPGTFHLAMMVTPNGDTCLHSLQGNDAAVFVNEMMSGESYQLSPGKNVMFRAGKISGATDAPALCGCPEIKIEQAIANSPEINLPESILSQSPLIQATLPAIALPRTEAAAPGTKQTPAASQPPAAQAHLEVDSSFVYHGDQAEQDYYGSVSRLSISTDNSKLALALLPKVSGPAVPAKAAPAKKPGVLHRFGNFVGRFFRG